LEQFYTYLWLREDGTPYYVGKGKGNRAYTSNGHRVSKPANDNIIVQHFDTEEDAFFTEKFLIALYGRTDISTGCLSNLTEGGDGVVGTLKKTHCIRGHERTPENISKYGVCIPCRYLSNLARFPDLEGLTEEERKQHKGRAVSKALKEYYKNPGAIEANSARVRAYYTKPGSRLKASKATATARKRPEVRAAMSAGQKRRFSKPEEKEKVLSKLNSPESIKRRSKNRR